MLLKIVVGNKVKPAGACGYVFKPDLPCVIADSCQDNTIGSQREHGLVGGASGAARQDKSGEPWGWV